MGECGATISVSKHSAASRYPGRSDTTNAVSKHCAIWGPGDGDTADDVWEHGAANSCPGVDDAANNLSKHDAATGRSGHGTTNCNARWSKCPGDHDTTRSAVYTTRNAIPGSTPSNCQPRRSERSEMVTQPGMQYVQPGMQYMQPNLQFQAQPTGIQEGVNVQETMTQSGVQYIQPGMQFGQEGEGMQYMQPDVQLQPLQLYT